MFWSGWGAVVVGVVLAVLVGYALRIPGRGAAVGGWAAAALLLVLAFPLHLLVEIPAAMTGYPSDRRDLGARLALVTGGLLFAGLANAAGPRHRPAPAGYRPVPPWARRSAYVAVALPVVGWAVPHGLWLLGVPFGISDRDLDDIHRSLSTPTGAAITLVPPFAGLLVLGLVQRRGQQFPRRIPGLGGRQVPRLLAVIPAGAVALTLTAYGAVSVAVFVGQLLTGALRWSDVREGWAVAATLLVFLGWGVALGATTTGYALVTRPVGSGALEAGDPHRAVRLADRCGTAAMSSDGGPGLPRHGLDINGGRTWPAASRGGPMTTINVNDIAVGIESFGADDAPLVLLAGGTTMLSWPDALCARLAAGGRRVVRYDLRDSGDSTTTDPEAPAYTLRDLSADAAALAEALGAGPVHLAGIGVGGMVAQVAVLDHPGAFSALTLVGSRAVAPGPPDDDLPDHDPATMGRLFARPLPDWTDREAVAAFAAAGAEILGDDPVTARATAARIWDRTPGTASSVQMANQMGMVFSRLDCTPRWRERLAEIGVPTLVVHGRRDAFFPLGNGAAIAREIPGARLLVLDEAASAIPDAAVGDVADAMLALG